MKKVFYRRSNILTFGIVLLIILGGSLFFIGRLINEMGVKLNKAVIAERGRLHFNLIKSEFSHTAEIVEFASNYLASTGDCLPETFTVIADIAFRLDHKISRIWFMDVDSEEVKSYYRDSDRPWVPASLAETEAVVRSERNGISGALYPREGTQIWSISARLEDTGGRPFFVGVDIPLPDLYSYMSAQNMQFASYATIFDGNGTIVLHPDSMLVASVATNDERRIITGVIGTGNMVEQTILSEFLGLPVERFYYPLDVAGERWVVAISVLWITIDEEIDLFHRYTAVITIIAVLLFSLLLAFSQSRWRREHGKRMAAEKHSSELKVQRIIDQINPHFLFNSLNSLYSLINSDPVLAREFILKLSGVYRYVLDRRTETLSTVKSEVEFIRQYIFLQKIRFGDQIEVIIDIDREIYDRLIPFMSLQTLVENAVKHNSFTPHEPLWVKIYTIGASLVVENNCSPHSEHAESTGLGLERLSSIYAYYTDDELVVMQSESVFICILPLIISEK